MANFHPDYWRCGHEKTPENTYVTIYVRRCRECQRAHVRRYGRRKRAEQRAAAGR